MTRHDDNIRLHHMLDHTREAITIIEGRRRADLDSDRLLELGLVRLVEIIGEAAARVGPDTRDRYPNIPWPAIVGMRNRLIHAYFDIDADRVWDTITDDLPSLLSELEKLIDADKN